MNKSGVQKILKALQLHSEHVDSKINEMNEKFENQMNALKEYLENRVDQLESTMNNRFERIEKKMDSLRIEWIETQETVDYLASKNVQHERKLRQLSS